MTLIAFLDEAGDHKLELVDKDFPVFVLVMLVCDRDQYIEQIVPTVYRLKMNWFGHEGVVLHSRDIRRGQGEFSFLQLSTFRQSFYESINRVMRLKGYTIIASIIRKQVHKDRYKHRAQNPYDLAFKFTLERLVQLLEARQQKEIVIIAESRGGKEDAELQVTFERLIDSGTEFLDRTRLRNMRFQLIFRSKSFNIIGTQLADLAAYPIGRWVLAPQNKNPSYDIIRSKIYSKNGKRIGLKIFP